MVGFVDQPDAEMEDMDDDVDNQGLHLSVKYVITQFLEDEHYKLLHQSLSQCWNRLHSLSAAMKLMEQYGVRLKPSEVEALAGQDEATQIHALVSKMPQQPNEQFQHFFLQLQLLVSTATRVRTALEDGNMAAVEAALDEADATGIAPYILHMAIVQAGTEVVQLTQQYKSWVQTADSQMGKLIRGQEDSMAAQKKLAAAQSQLSQFTSGQNEKAKKVLMTLAMGSSSAAMGTAFMGWLQYVKGMRQENEIRKEYEERIGHAEQRLLEFKTQQLSGVMGMMEKKGQVKIADLLAEVVKAWWDDVAYEKDVKENLSQVNELNKKLGTMQQSQAENTKKVLARLNADSDGTVMGLAFQAWVAFRLEYIKNKEMEDKIKATEKDIATFMKTKSDSARKVMQAMNCGTDTGVTKMAWDSWIQFWKENKEQAKIDEAFAKSQGDLRNFQNKGKAGANTVMERARKHGDDMIALKFFNAWRKDAKTEGTLRQYHAKIDGKRQQLLQVQQMFRNFATQLESGLKENADSARGPVSFESNKADKSSSEKRIMQKSDGTVSLPDINQKQKPGKGADAKPSPHHSGRGGNNDVLGPKDAWN